MKSSLRSSLLLLLTAMIWGLAFVAQDVAMESVRAFTFNGARMMLAALMLLVVCAVLEKKAASQPENNDGTTIPLKSMSSAQKKQLLIAGLLCGSVLAVASSLQQIGLEQGAAPGKAGFITALYIVLVPICGLFFGKKLRLVLIPAVVFSVAGLYLLCMTGSADAASGLRLETADIYLILCALGFTAHILIIDYFSPRTDCVKLSCLQFFVCSIICIIMACIFEKPRWPQLLDCLVPLLYAGLLSGGLGYTLQMVAQKDLDPTVASLIMCLESVFAVLGGLIILKDGMSHYEYIGCALMMCGILLAQWPEKKGLSAPKIPSGE
ncbi:MAG: DMT family transporter [Clostridiales bacterium]|nr:DMT family transporter [Clostridiales bacterium]